MGEIVGRWYIIWPTNASFPFDSIPEISVNYLRIVARKISNLCAFYHFLPELEGKFTSLIQRIFNDNRNDSVLNQFCGQFTSKNLCLCFFIFTYHGINCHNVQTFYEIHKPSFLPRLSTTFSTFHFPVVTSIKKWSARSRNSYYSRDR